MYQFAFRNTLAKYEFTCVEKIFGVCDKCS